ncbi:hypothetical protein [Glycomyces buryatensis]|uniref:hypothetical protein n=1 Tax=Glycomyces buryatensis TaxID=2570927 RepID=UPI00145627D4|nr:hypothetical protein [Glycomyces buryatensis]
MSEQEQWKRRQRRRVNAETDAEQSVWPAWTDEDYYQIALKQIRTNANGQPRGGGASST